MKKLLTISLLFTIFSCKQVTLNKEKSPENLVINNFVDKLTKEKLENYFIEMDFLKGEIQDKIDKIDISEFDFKNIEIVQNKGDLKKEGFLIKHKSSKYYLSIYSDGDFFYNPILIKIDLNNDLKYFSLNFGQILSLNYKSKFKNNILTTYTISENVAKRHGIFVTNKNSKVLDCGQATMDCINDAYNNHGWASVGLWVTSAFIPETAVAIAATCAARNCSNPPKTKALPRI